MSKKGRRTINPTPDPDPDQPSEDDVWIKTEPRPDNQGYLVTLSVGQDVAVTLDRDSALAYALYVQDAVSRARYDAAVVRQLTSLDIGLKEVGGLIADLRKDRPEMVHNWPIKLEPGVSHRDGHPFLLLFFNPRVVHGRTTEPIGQWETDAAVQHAQGVLDACLVADLDTGYLTALKGLIGLEEPSAMGAVDALAEFRRPGD